MHLDPPHELKSLSSPWPFAWWGMDILGPFTAGLAQNRYLVVGVDYFTKWVEAEPLSEITSFRVLRFSNETYYADSGSHKPWSRITERNSRTGSSKSSSLRSTQSSTSHPSSTPKLTGR
ncbi:gypsy retrotransposon integrase-like protein, partial [Trifolium medium]|nr:gypsy retrotransposon integrase-like protein [Trifolium medium]